MNTISNRTPAAGQARWMNLGTSMCMSMIEIGMMPTGMMRISMMCRSPARRDPKKSKGG